MSKNKNKNKNKDKNKKEKKEILNQSEKDVWRKIAIFLIIFFPYSLYLFLFKTKVPKWIKGFTIAIFIGLSFFAFDTVAYPDRVHNEVVFNNIRELKSKEDLPIGEVYHVDKNREFKYEDNEYMSFNIYDVKNMYYGIFEISEYNKDYNLVYLYRMDIEEKIIYNKNHFDEFAKIHPIIMEEILSNSQFYNFKNIKALTEVEEKDLFFNSKLQTIDILDEEVRFEFNEFGVIEYKSKSGNIDSIENHNPLLDTNFKSVYTVISRNFQDDFDIVGYNYYNGVHAFNLEVGNSKYVVEYYYGEGASLQSIDEEDVYMKFLKDYYGLKEISDVE